VGKKAPFKTTASLYTGRKVALYVADQMLSWSTSYMHLASPENRYIDFTFR